MGYVAKLHPAVTKATLLQWSTFSASCISICFLFSCTARLQIACRKPLRLLASLERLQILVHRQCNAMQSNAIQYNSYSADEFLQNAGVMLSITYLAVCSIVVSSRSPATCAWYLQFFITILQSLPAPAINTQT